MPTRTGNFPIGFRRGWGDWQRPDLKALCDWAKGAGFEVLDLGWATPADIRTVESSGLRLGSVDLLDFGSILHSDEAKRREHVAGNVAYVKEVSAAGAKLFFTAIIPGDPTRKRSENYALAVETYGPIVDAIRSAGAKLVIEGWPGRAPHYPSLCCTPETCRAFLRDAGEGVGLNYDPSHLIRLGVDPLRFLREFCPHVHHAHAKDAQLIAEAAYEFGLYQPAALVEPPWRFGEHAWRYTIPGHGQMDWGEAFRILSEGGYAGAVCVELEDDHFNGTEAGEKLGLTRSLEFLRQA
jgi:sugar phosphate isomerase/epimerase